MDLKVYRKEEVSQPDGTINILKPDIIDIYPDIIEAETSNDVKNHVWSLDNLQQIADVTVKDGKLVINSNSVRFENGKLVAYLTGQQLVNAEVLDDDTKELTVQECALASIWQKGLDPVELEHGIRWTEAIHGEINPLQLISDINDAIKEVSLGASVTMDTVEGTNGQEYLTFNLNITA